MENSKCEQILGKNNLYGRQNLITEFFKYCFASVLSDNNIRQQVKVSEYTDSSLAYTRVTRRL